MYEYDDHDRLIRRDENGRRIIDARLAFALIEDEVARRGSNYVYKAHNSVCLYTVDPTALKPEDRAGCIVGGALIIGLGARLVAGPESADPGRQIEGSIVYEYDRIADAENLRFTNHAILVFQTAQTVQDSGATHGQASDAVERLVYMLGIGLGGEEEVK